MTVQLTELVRELDSLLHPELFNDYCPNGLQVEGVATVTKLVSGVTACQALIDAAIDVGADAILVHHGYFWRGEDPSIRGLKKRRLASLLKNNISLLAYHLPLDAHPQLGNNAQLAEKLQIDITGGLDPTNPHSVGNVGRFKEPQSAESVLQRIRDQLNREPLHIGDAAEIIETVAWCSGGAQSYIEQAVAQGVGLFITGEVSEQTVHTAREEGIHFIAAGHHATERYGVQAVGHYLETSLGLKHQFVDIDNPA